MSIQTRVGPIKGGQKIHGRPRLWKASSVQTRVGPRGSKHPRSTEDIESLVDSASDGDVGFVGRGGIPPGKDEAEEDGKDEVEEDVAMMNPPRKKAREHTSGGRHGRRSMEHSLPARGSESGKKWKVEVPEKPTDQ